MPKRSAVKRASSGAKKIAKPSPRGRSATRKEVVVERAPGRGKYDRARSSDEREREQRRLILEAAGHVFAEKGWADATVEAIITRAGISRRTFYEHFDDLRECLLVLHQRITRATFRAVETQVASQSAPGEMLRIGVTAFLGAIAMFPHMARVVFRVARAAGPHFEAAHEAMMGRFVKLVSDGVAHSHALGIAGRAPDEIRVFALVSGMEAVAMRYVMRGEESKALEAAPLIIDMVEKVFSAKQLN